ncbi:MAG: NAD(P)/FAD-dependent oxidoreductase [Lachnospiraceae bacterium]|nr:NAD(P)/FAD-dependent oxidoreductase [Lachnospiraceae bacterium]
MNTIIIGAGAAGMMAAISAADNGDSVTILEKNEKCGKKIFITGKGRCNVTNNTDEEGFIKAVVRNPRFLYSSIYTWNSRKMMEFLEESGLKLKTERGNRVFPLSDHSSDVIKTLENACKKRGVKILLNTEVKDIDINQEYDDEKNISIKNQSYNQENVSSKDDNTDNNSGFFDNTNNNQIDNLSFKFILKSNKGVFHCDNLIIATGGKSYPQTGSTGDGYKFAEKFGHKVTALKPSLTPFNIKEEFCRDLSGLALKNVSLKLVIKKKVKYSEQGEMLFTHFGVSGPLCLSASSYYNNEEGAYLSLDLKPALSEEVLDDRILRDFDTFKNSQFKNSLNKLLPQSLIPVIVSLSGISGDKKVNEITKKERLNLVRLLKDFRLNIISLREFNEAIITSGGIKVSEVNPKTMESKLVPGLYFAGEILDVDALTGGYNLQIAWSTGYVAGRRGNYE